MPKKKRVRKASQIRLPEGVSLAAFRRFVQLYVRNCDSFHAAMGAGLGKQKDGQWDIDEVSRFGLLLEKHPKVIDQVAAFNDREDKSYALDFANYTKMLAAMMQVTALDYFYIDEKGRERLKPLALLTKVELMCLQDVAYYEAQASDGKILSGIAAYKIKLEPRTKLMELYSRALGFYEKQPPSTDVVGQIKGFLAGIELTDG